MITLGKFKALTFDCYGTLIDWETGILRALRPWARRSGVAAADAALLEAFSRAEPRCERATPDATYPDILRAVHRDLARHFRVEPTDTDADALATSVGDWPAFEDSAEALARLQQHYKLVIVSNVDRASFARSNDKLGVRFDAIVTAQDAGAYKPDHRIFHRAFDVLAEMGVARDDILHVAQSLYHDHVPAKALGLATVWVDRRGHKTGSGATPPPGAMVAPDLTVTTLAELARMIGPARQSPGEQDQSGAGPGPISRAARRRHRPICNKPPWHVAENQ